MRERSRIVSEHIQLHKNHVFLLSTKNTGQLRRRSLPVELVFAGGLSLHQPYPPHILVEVHIANEAR